MTRSMIALRPIFSPTGTRSLRRAAAVTATAAIAVCVPASGIAQDTGRPLEDAPVIIYDSPHDQRRAELRRALISDEDQYDNKRQRRKLSPEERSTLNQELRAVLRGVYDDKRRAPAEN